MEEKSNNESPMTIYDNALTPVTYDMCHQQPSRINIQMFKYQLDALQWMKGVRIFRGISRKILRKSGGDRYRTDGLASVTPFCVVRTRNGYQF